MIRHGHYLGYINDGCRADCCRRAWSIYMESLRLRHLRGECYADPSPARPAVDALRDVGVSWTRIAEAAGITLVELRKAAAGDPVRPETVGRLQGLTLDHIDGAAWVDGGRARALVAVLHEHGWTCTQVAGALGWSSPTLPAGWPHSRVTLRLVRRLQAAVDEVTAPRCVDCGGEPLPGGFARCLPCFQAATLPQTRSEIEDAARRRDAAARRRRQRAAAARTVAA